MDDAAIAALYEEALALERSGDRQAAIVALQKLLAADPGDEAGAAIRLAALGASPSPERAPAAYVASLFDQHADMFEITLVDGLGYDVPNLARDAVDRLGLGPFDTMLDLGCGTGLAGEAFHDLCGSMTGIDLSGQMIDICGDAGTYAALHKADILDWLVAADPEQFDLVTACDLLPYLGNLKPFFDGLGRVVSPNGVIVLSTELAACSSGWTVTGNHRFGHDPDYVERCLTGAGLAIRFNETINVRNEDGKPTPGQLIVAQAAG